MIKLIPNPYYIIPWQEEFEMAENPATRIVYLAIKSYTKNGERACEESYSTISKRAGIDDGWVKKCVARLIEAGWLIQEGEGTKRGGRYPILRIRQEFVKRDTRKVSFDSNETSTLLTFDSDSKSSDSNGLSSESSASKNRQSNKVKKVGGETPPTHKFKREKLLIKLDKMAEKYNLNLYEVLDKYEGFCLYYKSKGKKFDDEIAAFERWVIDDKRSGKYTLGKYKPEPIPLIIPDPVKGEYIFGYSYEANIDCELSQEVDSGFFLTEFEYNYLKKKKVNTVTLKTEAQKRLSGYDRWYNSSLSAWEEKGVWQIKRGEKVRILSYEHMELCKEDDD